LLDAHYADAIPLELLKTEQLRISKEIAAAENRLAAIAFSFDAVEANLARALNFAADGQTKLPIVNLSVLAHEMTNPTGVIHWGV
jgi:hypothetical protein